MFRPINWLDDATPMAFDASRSDEVCNARFRSLLAKSRPGSDLLCTGVGRCSESTAVQPPGIFSPDAAICGIVGT